MYNEKIEALIKAALIDGKLTEKEKQVLFKRAQAEGIDLDEFEMVLDARLIELNKSPKSSTPKSDKFGDVRKCPVCGALVPSLAGLCTDCGYEFSGIAAIMSSKQLANAIADIEEKYNSQISAIEGGTVDDGDRRWRLEKDKYSRIAQTIKTFPIPNTKADLFEFITVMHANMLSLTTHRLVADAYLTKYNEALLKINTLFSKDPMFTSFVKDQERIQVEYKKAHRKQKGLGLNSTAKLLLTLLGIILFLVILVWCGE